MKYLFVFLCIHGCFARNLVNYEEQKTFSHALIWVEKFWCLAKAYQVYHAAIMLLSEIQNTDLAHM